ncbi:hypothetical protein DC498_17735 [Terrimonas sp.]|uniref:hypothetical protein n=1 Tax=Terrimonas sp. TaxID=1914338 RepID=UPI000D51AC19|nr:hypothetical protein [Terrimonas sp.]PVD50814.1 hypothetical protein DC498_17735 [Terrimonas sp.]
MTIFEAFEELIQSKEFKVIAKKRDSIGGKYRLYQSRYNRNELKPGAIVEILIANGYEVTANKAVKKKS